MKKAGFMKDILARNPRPNIKNAAPQKAGLRSVWQEDDQGSLILLRFLKSDECNQGIHGRVK